MLAVAATGSSVLRPQGRHVDSANGATVNNSMSPLDASSSVSRDSSFSGSADSVSPQHSQLSPKSASGGASPVASPTSRPDFDAADAEAEADRLAWAAAAAAAASESSAILGESSGGGAVSGGNLRRRNESDVSLPEDDEDAAAGIAAASGGEGSAGAAAAAVPSAASRAAAPYPDYTGSRVASSSASSEPPESPRGSVGYAPSPVPTAGGGVASLRLEVSTLEARLVLLQASLREAEAKGQVSGGRWVSGQMERSEGGILRPFSLRCTLASQGVADANARAEREIKLRRAVDARRVELEAQLAGMRGELKDVETQRLVADRAAGETHIWEPAVTPVPLLYCPRSPLSAENAEIANQWKERSDAFEAAYERNRAEHAAAIAEAVAAALAAERAGGAVAPGSGGVGPAEVGTDPLSACGPTIPLLVCCLLQASAAAAAAATALAEEARAAAERERRSAVDALAAARAAHALELADLRGALARATEEASAAAALVSYPLNSLGPFRPHSFPPVFLRYCSA